VKFCQVCGGRLFLNRGVAVVSVDMSFGSAYHNMSYELECDTCGDERNIVMPAVPLFVNTDESKMLRSLSSRLQRGADEQLNDLLSSVERETGVHPDNFSSKVSYAKKYAIVERWLDENATRLNKSLMHDTFFNYVALSDKILLKCGDGLFWSNTIKRWTMMDELPLDFVNKSYSHLLSLSIESDEEFNAESDYDEQLWNDNEEEDFETEDYGYFDDLPF
jgi:hypothetical protein